VESPTIILTTPFGAVRGLRRDDVCVFKARDDRIVFGDMVGVYGELDAVAKCCPRAK
jgi:hypothetical protein